MIEIAFKSVTILTVSLLIIRPPIAIDIKSMNPFMSPNISPLLLLILDEIYPPKNAEIASTISTIYDRYSYGKREEAVKITAIIHNRIHPIHVDETTPSIIALIIFLLSEKEKSNKKITSDTNVFRGESFYY